MTKTRLNKLKEMYDQYLYGCRQINYRPMTFDEYVKMYKGKPLWVDEPEHGKFSTYKAPFL